LALADHAAIYAVAAPEMTEPALIRISQVRHLIQTMLRQRDTAQQQQQSPASTANEGPMAPLMPVPVARPPAGQKAEIAF